MFTGMGERRGQTRASYAQPDIAALVNCYNTGTTFCTFRDGQLMTCLLCLFVFIFSGLFGAEKCIEG